MPATQEDRLYGLTTSVAVKPAVAISADYNITLFGEQTITSSTFTGERTVTTTTGMRVLAMGQSSPIDNGIWIASPATWHRAPDFDGARDAVNGTLVFSIYGDCWQLEAVNPVQIGYSALEFRSTYPFSGEANLFERSLRVPEASVGILPPISGRANHLLAFNNDGEPIAVLPESGSAADVLLDLASSADGKGDALVAVKQPLTGSISRTQHNKNQEVISVLDFCVGDGVTDDTAGLQAALNSLAARSPLTKGGNLLIPSNSALLITGDVTIPPGVGMVGQINGAPPVVGTVVSNFITSGSRIKLSSAATIKMDGGSLLQNLIIHRSTMVGPEPNAASYAGTAITVIRDDITVKDMLIVGFAKILTSFGVGRHTIDNVKFDGIAGIEIVNSFDISRISNCHGWPFGTINSLTPVTTFDATNQNYRAGAAYLIKNSSWPKLTNNFSFGFAGGMRLELVPTATVVGNSIEGLSQEAAPYVLGTTGYDIQSCNDILMDSNHAVHFEHGCYINLANNNDKVHLVNFGARDCTLNGVAFIVGSGTVVSTTVTGRGPTVTINGIRTIATSGQVIIDDCTITNVLNGIQANGSLHVIGRNSFNACSVNVAETNPRFSVASAATIALSPSQEAFFITGTATITTISETYHGHRVTLTTNAAITLSNSGNLRLTASSLSLPPSSSITLMCEGATGSRTWRQMSPVMSPV